ncbi:MAG: cytidylate kinase family protein [Verrucomicrobiota bacterium]
MVKKVTITGDLGSGKSVIASLITEMWGFKKYSTGAAQRQIAQKYGMSTLELNQYTDTHPEIDQEIDAVSIELGKNDENLVMDSRMAWHFIPHSFKIKLKVDIEIAADRVMADKSRNSEKYDSKEQAIQRLQERRASEVARFKRVYNIDLEDDTNYDVVIDTSFASTIEVRDVIKMLAEKKWAKRKFARHWMSPKRLFPSKLSSRISEKASQKLQNGLKNYRLPVKATYFNDQYFIVYGYNRASAALLQNVAFLPVNVVGLPVAEEEFRKDLSLYEIQEWEKAHAFKFNHYPTLITS